MNMKPIMNKKGLFALVCALMGMTFSILTSCSDDLDVQQSYPFTVETMPVPKSIAISCVKENNPILDSCF